MKRGTMLWLLLFLAIVIICVWGYFTDSFPAPLPSHTPRTTATTTPPVSTSTVAVGFQIAKPFTFGSAQYDVTKIERLPQLSSSSATATASGSYVVVHITISDLGTAPLILGLGDFTLSDGTGHLFTVNQRATEIASSSNGVENIFAEAVQPGLVRSGVLAFDTPKDASGFSLQLSHGYINVYLGQ